MEFLESLNFLDIAMLIAIFILSLFSAVKGLFKNIVSFVLMIFAVLAAGLLAVKIRDGFMSSIIDDPGVAYVVSFLFVLICAYLIIFGIMKIFMKNNKEKEGIGNTFFALFIAIIKYVLIFSIISSTISSIDYVKDSELWENSQLAPIFTKVGDYAYNTKIEMQEVNLKDYVPKQVAGDQ